VRKILILGGSSFVGKLLLQSLNETNVYATYNRNIIKNGLKFDIVDNEISNLNINFESISHAVILLGDTEPNSCYSNITRSEKLNVFSIKKIIDFLKSFNINIIFCSTEFVFDGLKGMYSEQDIPNPILEYGRQKLEIENYLSSYSRHTILRLAKVYGNSPNDGTLFSLWEHKIKNGEVIICANDQYFSPVHVNDVILAIKRVIAKNAFGLFNISCGQKYSRLELLHLLIRNKFNNINIPIEERSIDDFNLPELRPKDVSMSSDKASNFLGIKFLMPENFLKNLHEAHK